MNNRQIARICHQTNKAFCESIEDYTQKDWDDAAEWQRDSAIKGVAFATENPSAPASAQHDAWVDDKVRAGWVYGSVKDESKKTHPCIVSYENLPVEQRIKDYLFKAVVSAFVKASAE